MRKYKHDECNDFVSNFQDDFGDDFEVRYTEDLPDIQLDLDDEKDTRQYNETPDYTRRRRKNYDHNTYESTPHRKNRKRPSSELAAPIQNIVHTGSSLVETLMRLVFRPAPVLMSAIILLITAFSYWNDSEKYGDILTIIKNPYSAIVTFLAVGAVIVLWELCCLFFTISGVWTGTGRGLSFFILVYLLSYAASLAGSLLPEGIEIIEGIRGGLNTYGSLYSMIFPFCVIGSIACIIQKIMGR